MVLAVQERYPEAVRVLARVGLPFDAGDPPRDARCVLEHGQKVGHL